MWVFRCFFDGEKPTRKGWILNNFKCKMAMATSSYASTTRSQSSYMGLHLPLSSTIILDASGEQVDTAKTICPFLVQTAFSWLTYDGILMTDFNNSFADDILSLHTLVF